MQVKAIARGFFGGRLYRVGEVFELPAHMTPGKWLQPVAAKKPEPKKPEGKKPTEKNEWGPEADDLV